MANFEAFLKGIKLSANLLFLKSEGLLCISVCARVGSKFEPKHNELQTCLVELWIKHIDFSLWENCATTHHTHICYFFFHFWSTMNNISVQKRIWFMFGIYQNFSKIVFFSLAKCIQCINAQFIKSSEHYFQ